VRRVFWPVVFTVLVSAFGGTGEAQSLQECLNLGPYSSEINSFDLTALLPPQPNTTPLAVDGELAELHRIQQTRTEEEIKQANDDANELNMFPFHTVLGEWFNEKSLPATRQLSLHVCVVANALAGKMKNKFNRQRPYVQDPTLQPVRNHDTLNSSYPSGHSITGYLEALTLAEIFPKRRAELMERANEFAQNRLVCGVHYRSDIVAGQVLAYGLFDQLKTVPAYQKDLDAARSELEGKLKR
jgi:acid phosphatase (class A)